MEIRKSVEVTAIQFARSQGLKYVSDQEKGYTRRKAGKGFVYLDDRARRVKNQKVIKRIQSLVIPPAWQEVWICPHPNGHLQVTGRDARRRKQYKYHPDWSQSRNETKFEKLLIFGQALQKIRARVEKDLRLRGLPREKVLAAVVRIMELGHLRVGNDEYSRTNNSYGLTTLKNTHVKVQGSQVRFRYRGKSGGERDITLMDPTLSRIVRNCQDLPGQELFGYRDDEGQVRDVRSEDVNNYLKEISGEPITAKDFRTWGGTVKALEEILRLGKNEKESEASFKRRELEVIRAVSSHLGNTVSVCRKYYVAPVVFAADRDGRVEKICSNKLKKCVSYSRGELLLLELIKNS